MWRGASPRAAGQRRGRSRWLWVCPPRCPESSRAAGWGGGARPGLRRPPPASPCALQETYKLPHRLIEKKRRDRINECIAQLKDLLPEHLKLTVSERLAALRAGSPAWRAGGGHSPPAGPAGNCRAEGWVPAEAALFGGTLAQGWRFRVASCK